MILNAFTERELLLARIYLIGVDGTNVNTGKWHHQETGGKCASKKMFLKTLKMNLSETIIIIFTMQEYLGHPVQWMVCLLHTNELPLRK